MKFELKYEKIDDTYFLLIKPINSLTNEEYDN